MLDKNPKKSLDRSKDRAMQHNRSFVHTVVIHIFELEFFWKRHVELNCSTLPGSSERIENVYVDLRSVEGAIAFIDLVGLSPLIKRIF